MNQRVITANDAQGLAFVTAQAYKINTKVYEARYPDWDFGRFAFVDTSGPAWSPGILTYLSDVTGKADWQSGYAKDIPLADVNQDMQLKTFHLAAIGYQWNIQEVNTALNIVGGSLPDRRARAARMAYQKFMYNVTLFGDATKGLYGITNYPGVPVIPAPNDGTGSARNWIDISGVGLKTPAQIVRDINLALTRVNTETNTLEYADTIILPVTAYDYIAGTPYSAFTMETVLSFVSRTNVYTQRTGRPLSIFSAVEMQTAAIAPYAGQGRMTAYKNDQDYLKVHLPMPHQFLGVYQDGPLNWMIPGIFRTGGLEMLTTKTAAYLDAITPAPV